MSAEFNFKLGDHFIAFVNRDKVTLDSSLKVFRDGLREISELLTVSWRCLSSRKIPISEAQEKIPK